MITVKVNSQEWGIAEGTTISNLVSQAKVSTVLCVVERNGEIVAREDYCQVVLGQGDQVELIRFMAGG